MKIRPHHITGLGLILLGGGLAINYFKPDTIPLWIPYGTGGPLIVLGTFMNWFGKK